MKVLVPVDVVSDALTPPTGSLWTTPEMYDPERGEPGYSMQEAARFFFARSRSWLNRHLWEGHLVLDGVPLEIPREANNDYLRWRLYDVERTAHALAQNGYLKIGQLHRAIGIIKLVAENYNYLLGSPIESRIVPKSNEVKRTALMAIETVTVVRDDLDDSEGAVTRHFSIEEVHYRVDLTDENWQAFLDVVKPFVAVSQPDRRRRIASPEERDERKEIRAWAAERGYKVGERGRIPFEVVNEYKQAHPKKIAKIAAKERA